MDNKNCVQGPPDVDQDLPALMASAEGAQMCTSEAVEVQGKEGVLSLPPPPLAPQEVASSCDLAELTGATNETTAQDLSEAELVHLLLPSVRLASKGEAEPTQRSPLSDVMELHMLTATTVQGPTSQEWAAIEGADSTIMTRIIVMFMHFA